MAVLVLDGGRFNDGRDHVGRAMSYAVGYVYSLSSAMMLRAVLWHKQHRPEEARFEVLCTVEIFEKLGATQDVEGSSSRSKGN